MFSNPTDLLLLLCLALALLFLAALWSALSQRKRADLAEDVGDAWKRKHDTVCVDKAALTDSLTTTERNLAQAKEREASKDAELKELRAFHDGVQRQRRAASAAGAAASAAKAAAKREAKPAPAPKPAKTTTKSDRGAARKKRG